MPDRPLLDHDTSVQPPSSARQRPVCLEIPVTIQGFSDAESAGSTIETFQPFLQESKTVLVFSRGAVVRLTAGAQPGQRVVLTNRNINKQIPCRVMQSRHYPNARGYIELEFLEPSPGFWGVSFPDETPAAAPPPPSASRPAPPQTSVSPAPPKLAAPLNAAPPVSPPSPIVPAKVAPPPAEKISLLADSVRLEPPALSAPAPQPPSPFRISPPLPAPLVSVSAPPPIAPLSHKETLPLSSSLSSRPSPIVPSAATDSFGSGVLAQREISAPAPEKSSRRMPLVIAAAACTILSLAGAWFYFRSSAETLPLPAATVASPAPAPMESQPTPTSPAPDPSAGVQAPVNSASVASPIPTASGQASVPEIRLSTIPEKSPAPASNKPVVPSPAVGSASPMLSSSGFAAANPAAPPSQPQRKPLPTAVLSVPVAAPRDADANETPPPDFPENAPAISSANQPSLPGGLVQNSAAPAPPVRTGGVVKQPRLLSSVAPVYPLLAKQNHVTGDVVVAAVVDVTGKVISAKALSGPTLLQQTALDAVRQFKYEPATLNGQPTQAPVTITLRFR